MKKLRFPDLIVLNEQMMIWLNGNATDKMDKSLIIKNLESYLKFLKTDKHNETIAHFAALLEDKKFGKVAGWVLIDSMEIMTIFEQFISGIQLVNK